MRQKMPENGVEIGPRIKILPLKINVIRIFTMRVRKFRIGVNDNFVVYSSTLCVIGVEGMPPITRLVIETGSCGNSSAQRPTNCNANSVKTLIFGISGAPYTDLGTSGPTRLYAVDLRHGSVLCPANRSQLRRTQFESPCERACEKRLSSNGFMQCLAIHRYFYVFSVQIIYTSHRSKLDLEYYCVV